jgi:putative ABC transport system permease protein
LSTAPPLSGGADADLVPHLRAADVLPVATTGLRAQWVRAVLSTLGVAIGIAAVVAVLGITRSSQASLLFQIDQLGTNLLTVVNGQSLSGTEVELPATASRTIAVTEGVLASAPTAELPDVPVFKSNLIPTNLTGGLSVRAVDPSLLSTLNGRLAAGTFLTGVTSSYPTAVLGWGAATTLGINTVAGRPRVWLGNHWYLVIGIVRPFQLAPELDNAAMIGFPTATQDFHYDGHASRIYVRARTDRTIEVAGMLARSASPSSPSDVSVSRPSDALSARLAVAGSTTSLFLGLGAVALLVGGIGIANVMVIAVLERRNEIGLRRALGAARRHVAVQFLVESLLLGVAGGTIGVLIGAAVTYGLAAQRGWQPLVPPLAIIASLGVAIAVGGLAGLYPAMRAARLSPTDALRTS